MAFVGTERFQLLRRLGEGGFGVVYEALDRQRSARVALKLLRSAEGTTLYRFKREFRALADVFHSNLVGLHELHTEGDHWFFTMELVDGFPMVQYVRPPQPAARPEDAPPSGSQLDELRLRRALPQLVDALHAIHRAGIVHCDVKPSNVLVTHEGRVVVLDFGLASERALLAPSGDTTADTSLGDLVVLGTPAYMAPEQARSQRVTPAADWYSVGVMIYEALTGVLPFTGSHLEIINAKQGGRPRPPTALSGSVPKDLSALCMNLLRTDPEERLHGDAILQCVGRPATPVQVPSVALSVDTFLGRRAHLRQLSDALRAVALGEESIVAIVSGLSGMGKTALIRRFLDDEQGEHPRILVLAGRCYERESMPYKALDPLIDALAQYLRPLRDLEVARLLPRDAGVLARLFPVLLSVDEIRRAPLPHGEAIDALTLRQRAAAALRELLFGLAIRGPLVLVIDDAQWGDADSGWILREVMRPPDPPPLLLVVACRAEEIGGARLLQTLGSAIRAGSKPRVLDLEVGPLGHDDARQLATVLTGGAGGNADRAEAIARESGGNAFFLHELAHHALTLGGPARLDAVVRDRVAGLPEATRQLLVAVALSAQSIPGEVASAATGLEVGALERLHLLRTARLVRGRSDEGHVEPYHDRIREAVVSQLGEGELKVWHRRLAVAWEASRLARPETLVTHYHAAGDDPKTIEYAAVAAERAQDALAFDRAAEFYGLLVRLERDVVRQRHWYTRLGDALTNAGRGFEAAGAFLKALDTAPGSEAIELQRRAAAEFIRAGYLDEAAGVLDDLLPKIGVAPPRSDARALLILLAFRLLLVVRGTRFRERPEARIPEAELRRIDVLRTIGEPLGLSSLVQGAALITRAAWYALQSGETGRVIKGLTGLAALEAMGGTRTEKRSQRLAREARALAQHLDDPWASGRVVLAEGMSLKVSGHWKRGVERLERACEIFASCTGVRWEIETAQTLIHDALYWMGEWRRLAREIPARRHEAEQRGDLYSATHVAARLSPLVHLAEDRADLARVDADTGLSHWTKRYFHLQHRHAVCSGVDVELYSGDAEAASRRLEAAWPALRRIMFVFQNGRIEMRYYRARIALALAAQGRTDVLAAAERDAGRLDREGAEWACALAALVRATASHLRGRTELAMSGLERADTALRECDMNIYAAAARYRRGVLMGGASGRALTEEAIAVMRHQGIVNPARMADLLAPGFSEGR